ncbi:hypothetical protein Ancab_039984 [Ancistrocladus abbreviatus]
MAPIFSKPLTKTDVNNRLSWPMDQLSRIPGTNTSHEVPFLVADDFGNRWKFICSTRDEHYLKPVIIGEWMKFARAKALKKDDQLIFYEHEDPAVRFLVQVQRQIDPPLHLGGANIGTYPIH